MNIIVAMLVAVCLIFSFRQSPTSGENVAVEQLVESTLEDDAETDTVETPQLPELIDLQPTVDSWRKSITGSASVYIYDLDHDQVVASYNETENYNTASLYKLFVVYEGYRRVASGEWQLSTKYYGKYTLGDCLDLAIRESNSACAETLWEDIGRSKLDKIVKNDFNITNSKISSLLSNPADIAKMLQIYHNHEDLSDDLVEKIKDSMLNQPVTDYNWRQGLPTGFSDDVSVYNKVGWEYDSDENRWNYYHDAAIVEIDGHHYIVVVMTKNLRKASEISKLGSMLEKAVLSS